MSFTVGSSSASFATRKSRTLTRSWMTSAVDPGRSGFRDRWPRSRLSMVRQQIRSSFTSKAQRMDGRCTPENICGLPNAAKNRKSRELPPLLTTATELRQSPLSNCKQARCRLRVHRAQAPLPPSQAPVPVRPVLRGRVNRVVQAPARRR